jgi:hypothetical protein
LKGQQRLFITETHGVILKPTQKFYKTRTSFELPSFEKSKMDIPVVGRVCIIHNDTEKYIEIEANQDYELFLFQIISVFAELDIEDIVVLDSDGRVIQHCDVISIPKLQNIENNNNNDVAIVSPKLWVTQKRLLNINSFCSKHIFTQPIIQPSFT